MCDARCKFLEVNCSWPGSVHYSPIFFNSKLLRQLQTDELNGILLRDSGYERQLLLLTPYTTHITPIQIVFNNAHRSTRVRIEMAIGQLKQRFASLQNPLRINVERCSSFIVSCFILHNICKNWNDPDPDINYDEDPDFADQEIIEENNYNLQGRIRVEISQSLYLMRA